jgi:hypothetical protein
VHVVSWRARGLQLREIRPDLALAAVPILPSPWDHKVGISNSILEAQYPAHHCLCLRFGCPLTEDHRKTRGQDGSLFLSCRALSSPTTCRFIPALDPFCRSSTLRRRSWANKKGKRQEPHLRPLASNLQMPSHRPLRSHLLFALVFCASASGQRIRVGVVGGGDWSRDFSGAFFPASSMGSGYERTSNVKGYVVGPTMQIRLRRRLDLEIDALFKPLGFTDATVLLDGSRRSVSPATVVTWQFPLLIKYQLSESRIAPFVVGGPSLRTSGNLNGTNPSSAGITAGAGVTLPWGLLRFEPSVRYTRWNADQLGPGAMTRPDQVEFLLGVTTAGAASNWKPLHKKASLGAILGATLTDRLRRSDSERRFLAGPQVGLSVRGPISLQFNAIYSPIGKTNVTWEFPVLVRFSPPSPASQRMKPLVELGPTFRTPQEINGSALGRVGLAAGGGMELPAGPIRITSVLRYTHWAPESNPARSLVFRNQVQLLFGVSF